VVTPPADIARRGAIRFGTCFDAPPQEYLDEFGEPAGADVDIGVAVASLMGVGVRWLSLGFDDIVEALLVGRCDAINSSLSYTEERDQVLDFVLHGVFTDVVLVPAGNPQTIVSVNDLAGKEVGWVSGYAPHGMIEMEQALAANGLAPPVRVAFPGEADALAALRAGAVDAVTLADVQGDFHVGDQPGVFELVPAIRVFPRGFGFAVREGDHDLRTALRTAIDLLYEDGTMCDILRRWNLTSTADPARPCAQQPG
jgi:polar amino acid transport system substrate-binding protein